MPRAQQLVPPFICALKRTAFWRRAAVKKEWITHNGLSFFEGDLPVPESRVIIISITNHPFTPNNKRRLKPVSKKVKHPVNLFLACSNRLIRFHQAVKDVECTLDKGGSPFLVFWSFGFFCQNFTDYCFDSLSPF